MLYNHGEGPYKGLPLVESSYYQFPQSLDMKFGPQRIGHKLPVHYELCVGDTSSHTFSYLHASTLVYHSAFNQEKV